jgi:hypothetical protein
MRFDIDRICELAGLGAASGGLISEAAAPAKPAPVAADVKPAADAKSKKPAAPAAEGVVADKPMDEVVEETEAAHEDGYAWDSTSTTEGILDEEMYEIDEMALMEALVELRQQRLEENAVRDAVRDEIKRALSDKSGSWVYGGNKPTASRQGQIARGGFGVGFGFKR